MDDEAARRIAEIMWKSRLERASEEHPDYRFYVPPLGLNATVGPRWPDHISTLDAEYPAGKELPALHESRLRWPERDKPSSPIEPLTPDEVVERAAIDVSHIEEEEKEPAAGRWRKVTLRTEGRELEDHWDLDIGEHKFEEPWPATAAQVLTKLATSAAEVDDGRNLDDWLFGLPDSRAAKLTKRFDREPLEEMLEHQRASAWRLYRFLGPELYERLVASYRQPMEVVRFGRRSAEERMVEYNERLARAGRRARERRERIAFTVGAAAELLGVSAERLTEIEAGSAELTAEEVMCICDLYEISPGRLLA